MDLVVDVNILFASFLKEAKTRELLLDMRLNLYAPEHLISETSRHLGKEMPLRRRIHFSDEVLGKLVRFLTHVPKFVGPELEEYGPFESEDIANLPAEIAEVLIDKGKVEEIIEEK